jgi:hypothetical protein
MTRKRDLSDDEANSTDNSIWRPIAGFMDYEVADLCIRGDRGVVRKISTNRLVGQFISTGYKRVNLVADTGKRVMKLVHILTVLGDKPSATHTVDHITSTDKLNNLSSNLRWATRKQQSNNRDLTTPRVKLPQLDVNDYEFREIPFHMIRGTKGYFISKKEVLFARPEGVSAEVVTQAATWFLALKKALTRCTVWFVQHGTLDMRAA